MDYGVAEIEIAGRLNAWFSENDLSDKFEATPVPETVEEVEYWKANMRRGMIGVEYSDSNYDPDNGLDAVRVEERARFRLVYQAPRLRGELGVWRLIEHSKKAVIGFRPSDGGGLYPVKFGAYQAEQNGFQFYLDFECRTLNSEASATEPAPIGGPLKSVESQWNDFYNAQ